MARITGIGGVFLKTRKGTATRLAKWYEKNLGLSLEEWGGAVLRWREDKANDGGATAWHVADKNSKWFSPSRSSFMINYRVDDMAGMMAKLKKGRVKVIQGPEHHENGVFAWILDPEGNKVELWQPMKWDPKNKKG